jgi:hyperosmotically inducible periplasmic protein
MRKRAVWFVLSGYVFLSAAAGSARAAEPAAEASNGAASSQVQARSSDRQLAKNVRLALRQAGGIDMAALTVRVKNGVVTLAGSVPSSTESARAAEVSAKVSGVAGVKNKLTVQTQEN